MGGGAVYCDYVLFGKDGSPLAVVEAKRTSKDPNVGRKQVMLYADCLERKFGRRPMMFTTNGFETYFWDDKTSPQRPVSGIFSKDDLQKNPFWVDTTVNPGWFYMENSLNISKEGGDAGMGSVM